MVSERESQVYLRKGWIYTERLRVSLHHRAVGCLQMRDQRLLVSNKTLNEWSMERRGQKKENVYMDKLKRKWGDNKKENSLTRNRLTSANFSYAGGSNISGDSECPKRGGKGTKSWTTLWYPKPLCMTRLGTWPSLTNQVAKPQSKLPLAPIFFNKEIKK